MYPLIDPTPLLSPLRHPGITSGLVKGALSVAASAYKALFTGQGPTQVSKLIISNNLLAYLICYIYVVKINDVQCPPKETKNRDSPIRF